MTRKSHKRGFSLIEAAIVLGVVGLVIGGIWIAASAVSDHSKVNSTLSGVVKACDKAASLFVRRMLPSGSYEQDILSAAIAVNAFPTDWVKGSTVKSPIGGNILMSILGPDYAPIAGGAMPIYLTDVPQKYCRQLLPKINVRTGSYFVYSIVVGTGPNNNYDWTTSTGIQLPYSGDIAQVCGASALIKIEIDCVGRY